MSSIYKNRVVFGKERRAYPSDKKLTSKQSGHNVSTIISEVEIQNPFRIAAAADVTPRFRAAPCPHQLATQIGEHARQMRSPSGILLHV